MKGENIWVESKEEEGKGGKWGMARESSGNGAMGVGG